MPFDDSTGPTDDPPVTELRALINGVHDSGVSFEAMAVRARHAGFQISKQYFNEVARGRIRLPKDERLAALAAGLPGISETTVREAAARSANIHVSHNVDYATGQLLGFVRDMAPANRDRWFRLSQAIARELAEEEKTGAPRTVIVTDTGKKADSHTERRSVQSADEAEQRVLRGEERRRRQG